MRTRVDFLFLSGAVTFLLALTRPPLVSAGSDAAHQGRGSGLVRAGTAVAVAEAVLDDLVREGKSGWTAQSRAVAAYPIYIPGIEGVSFHEIKITTGGRDSGYILVNVNKTDLQVPELTSEATTLHEIYREKTGRRDLKIYRYDWFRSVAVRTSGGKETMVAAIGFSGHTDVALLDGPGPDELRTNVAEYDQAYRKEAGQKRCVPYYLKEEIDLEYLEIESAAQLERIDGVSTNRIRSPLSGDTHTRYFLKYIMRVDGARAMSGDFDSDGRKDDVGAFNQDAWTFSFDYDHNMTQDASFTRWGLGDDRPLAGDFDRDGFEDDVVLFRPSSCYWYVDLNRNGNTDKTVIRWGNPGDIPVVGDFDSDGHEDDLGVFRPSDRKWYYDYDHDRTTNYISRPWANSGDIPLVGDFDRDGYLDDVAVFRSTDRKWYYDYNHNATTDATSGPWAENGDQALSGDFDGDGFRDDIAIYRPTDASWWYDDNRDSSTDTNYGPWGETGNNWHLPSWHQPQNGDGYPVGCGNTAWAMVYAYWKHFKGKTALFNGTDLTNLTRASACDSGIVNQVMWALADYNDTFWGGSGSDKWGATLPGDMPHGIDYARAKGYASASCGHWQGADVSKWTAIRDEIRSDRPVILYITLDHYICIEAVHYIDRGRGKEKVYGYLGNWGWGETGSITHKWFYTRPLWWDPHYNTYNAYFPRM
ncbi:MAG: VCBS repeat-containing protein [Acidobacteriota bacterium]